MENWNRNNWQGRRKDQVEYSNKVVFYCLVAMVTTFLMSLVII